MAEATPRAPQLPDGVAQLVQLQNLLKGFTGQETRAIGTSSPQALDALMRITDEYSRGNAITDANALFQSILQQAAIQFAPLLGQARGAGVRNSSSVGMLGEQAQVAATGEATRALLQAIAQYGQISSGAASSAAQATRGTTQTTKAKVDPTSILTQIGPLLALQAYKKATAKTGAEKASGFAANVLGNRAASALEGELSIFGGGVDTQAFANSLASSSGLYNPETLSVSDILTGRVDLTGGAFGDVLPEITQLPFNFLTAPVGESALVDFGTQALADIGTSTAADLGTSALADAGTSFLTDSAISIGADPLIDIGAEALADFGVNAGIDAATSVGADAALGTSVPYFTIAKAAGDLFDIEEIQDLTQGVSEVVNDVVSGIGDFVSGIFDSIICAALYRAGKLTRRELLTSTLHFKTYARDGYPVEGYYLWARPYVRLMRRSPLAVRVAQFVMRHRIRYIQRKLGRPIGWQPLGAIFAGVLFAVSWICGHSRRLLGPKYPEVRHG